MLTMLCLALCFRSVKDLARLSLKEPMYVSVHEHSAHSTPARLEQVLSLWPNTSMCVIVPKTYRTFSNGCWALWSNICICHCSAQHVEHFHTMLAHMEQVLSLMIKYISYATTVLKICTTCSHYTCMSQTAGELYD